MQTILWMRSEQVGDTSWGWQGDAYPNMDFEVSYPGGAKQFNIM
jgi:hypothetical protein